MDQSAAADAADNTSTTPGSDNPNITNAITPIALTEHEAKLKSIFDKKVKDTIERTFMCCVCSIIVPPTQAIYCEEAHLICDLCADKMIFHHHGANTNYASINIRELNFQCPVCRTEVLVGEQAINTRGRASKGIARIQTERFQDLMSICEVPLVFSCGFGKCERTFDATAALETHRTRCIHRPSYSTKMDITKRNGTIIYKNLNPSDIDYTEIGADGLDTLYEKAHAPKLTGLGPARSIGLVEMNMSMTSLVATVDFKLHNQATSDAKHPTLLNVFVHIGGDDYKSTKNTAKHMSKFAAGISSVTQRRTWSLPLTMGATVVDPQRGEICTDYAIKIKISLIALKTPSKALSMQPLASVETFFNSDCSPMLFGSFGGNGTNSAQRRVVLETPIDMDRPSLGTSQEEHLFKKLAKLNVQLVVEFLAVVHMNVFEPSIDDDDGLLYPNYSVYPPCELEVVAPPEKDGNAISINGEDDIGSFSSPAPKRKERDEASPIEPKHRKAKKARLDPDTQNAEVQPVDAASSGCSDEENSDI